MKPSQFYTLLIVMVVAWGSLFYTIVSTNLKQNRLLKTDSTLLSNDSDILTAERTTQTDLQNKVNDLQNHIDCLFNLATKPNHSSAFIADAASCQITTPAVDSPNKGVSAHTTPHSGQPSTNKSNMSPPGQPSPKHPLVCNLSLGILCL